MNLFFTVKVCFLVIFLTWSVIPASTAAPSDFRKRVHQTGPTYNDSDVEAEILFGRELAAKILGQYPLLKDEKIQRYVSTVGTGITAQLGRSELTYYFAVLDTDELNAYACPGGYIFITRGALQVMVNEAQLVGVLTHEMSHIDQRHVVKELKIKGKDDSLTSGMAGILGGTTTSVRVAMDMLTDKAFKLLFQEGLSKQDEFEADSLAAIKMASLGYDWKSYRDYVAGLSDLIKVGAGDDISKTHPAVDDRIAKINAVAQEYALQESELKTNKERLGTQIQFPEVTVAKDFSDFTARTEILLGRDMAARLLNKYPQVKNPYIQKYIGLLGTGVAAQFGRSELQHYFSVLDTDEIASYACPGGYIFITRGAIQAMEDEAQLVGVLSREVVNVEQQHMVELLKMKHQSKDDASVRLPVDILSEQALIMLLEDGLPAKDIVASERQVIEILTTLGYGWNSYLDFVSAADEKSAKKSSNVSSDERIKALRLTVEEKGLKSYEGKQNQKRFKKYLQMF